MTFQWLSIIIALALIGLAIACRTPACDVEAHAPLIPRIEEALANKDSAALAALAVELGHDVYVCALKAHAQSKGSASGSPPADGGITDGGKP